MSPPLAFFDFLSFPMILMLAAVGVLLYGERLPQVAAQFGRQLMQLKKSMQGIREDFESAVRETTSDANRTIEKSFEPVHEEATSPKFEPPPAEPTANEPDPNAS